MKANTRTLLIILGLAIVGVLGYLVWGPAETAVSSNAALETLLVDDGQTSPAFARATEPDAVQFPRDLGPHEEYQTEWWYYTGNLATAEGRPFGYQFTIFRRALLPSSELPDVADPSAWRSEQLYLAHFTISDIGEDIFYDAERFSRDGAGLAGAQAEPYAVWLEDWSVKEIAPGQTRLQAQTGEVALDLVLTETLAPVLHGDGGLSRKGPEPGNASYYYSIVRQASAGTVSVGEETFAVSGLSWKDHEYSTSALSPGSVGWDWLSLQLDDGSSLMLFEIRREDGSLEPYSSGSFVAADGMVRPLALGDWQLEVLDTWRSPHSGADYPAAWRLTIPELELVLEGQAQMADQELNVSTIYWEGAVKFAGERAGEPLTAQGYLEMTGYAGTPAPS
jgi:predicted secreted hydrolase